VFNHLVEYFIKDVEPNPFHQKKILLEIGRFGLRLNKITRDCAPLMAAENTPAQKVRHAEALLNSRFLY